MNKMICSYANKAIKKPEYLLLLLISIALVALVSKVNDEQSFTGKIKFLNGTRVVSTLTTSNIFGSELDVYIEDKWGNTNIFSCNGELSTLDGSVYFNTKKVDGMCLGKYQILRVSNHCLFIKADVISSENQKFLVCEQRSSNKQTQQ